MSDTASQYVNDCHRNFSMYVLQTRAFPSLADGLRHGARRLLWTARNGDKYKTATLAGATMPLHPHADASDTIDTLAKPYGNNIPLFDGKGSFGTRLKPGACGAPRYTSVLISGYTKDVMFRDIELVPMVENYDGTLMEPLHFLPLVPNVLVNPAEGVGVGFSTKILPRAIGDIVDAQLAHLAGKSFDEPKVTFTPFNSQSVRSEVIKSGNTRYWFHGTFERLDTSTIRVTNIPYGLDHADFVEYLAELLEEDIISSFDDQSSSTIDITIKFGRGALKHQTDDQIIKSLNLRGSVVENFNVVDFSGERVASMDYKSVIQQFTDWRLTWYLARYQRLKELLEKDIQRYRDIILAIEKNVGDRGRKSANKKALTEWLSEIGVVYTDYIADLPIYRLTVEEADKARKKLEEALVLLAEYQKMIDSPEERKKVYVSELKEVKKKYHVPFVPPADATAAKPKAKAKA